MKRNDPWLVYVRAPMAPLAMADAVLRQAALARLGPHDPS